MAIGQTIKSTDMADTYMPQATTVASNTTRATSRTSREMDKGTIFTRVASNTPGNGKRISTTGRARRPGLMAARTKDNTLEERNVPPKWSDNTRRESNRAKAFKYGRMGSDMRGTSLMT